ncbi:YlbF family regulator [Pullulanibacillus sp. KACC 23026]|uniref:YlbF family regulator n=1 Tax=Pullulanibacillus sp. KACC 23026 TaxID=3028315 RepID=UPI0023AF2B70|nr:YlbF family regulator [Pullulanibacillus sp. KACC 23026]WEG15007.1 YlbF family regulator [Pullulanibacillus sp. KACC 23026]
MLRQSEPFERYKESKKRLEQDQQAISLLRRFVKLRERYDEVQRFGKYHPDYHEVIQEMMEVKRDVDLNDIIAEYKQAEAELESLLNDISLSIAGAVSPSIKVPTGDPFFDRGCSGGCSTGGACGCH